MDGWKLAIFFFVGIVMLFVWLYVTIDFNVLETKMDIYRMKSNISEYLSVETNELELLMVGDVLIHPAVYDAAYIGDNKYDFNYMFDDVREKIGDADLAFYNQESIIGGKELGLDGFPRFNSPDEIGEATINAGFDLISLANNHTYDQGEKGIINSLNFWSDKKVVTAGSYLSYDDRDNIFVGETNNISYAFLSYTTLTNGLNAPKDKEYLVNVYDEAKVKEDIEKVRNKVDLIFVSMHWGAEYTLNQINSQEEIAEYLASLGVDVIIGHHPHVVEPIEYIGDTIVIYSLGNFLSNQYVTSLDRAVGAMVTINFQKIEDGNNVIINKTGVEATLTYCYRDGNRKFRIYPFDIIDENILSNYKTKYEKYKNVITKLESDIVVTGLGE